MPSRGPQLFVRVRVHPADRPEAALEPLRKAIQIDPDCAEAHFVLGTALRQAGRAAEGKQEQKISVDLQEKRRTAD